MFAIETSIDPEQAAHWLMVEYFGVALWRYIVAATIILVSLLFKKIFELVIIRWLTGLFSKSHLRYEGIVFDALSKPLNAFLLILGVHLALLVIRSGSDISPEAARFLTSTVYVAFGLLAVWTAYRLVGTFADVLDDMAQHKSGMMDRQFVPLIKRSLRIVVLVLGLLTVLSSMNVDVGSLVTGLGIGGAAMALAAQDSLGNIFGSVALLADRSIKVGDWIKVGDHIDGIVEAIGLRSTRIRTWPKTLVTIPNKMLANEVIDNWAHMPKRRVKQMVGLEYCRPDQMELILEDIREILRQDHGVDQDFSMVHWTDFGQFSLDVMVYYFTKAVATPDHLAVKERINLKILAATLKRGVNVAFPTQKVFMQSVESNSL